MLDTIEECNERLAEIDSQLEQLRLLQLERQYIFDRRKLLIKENLPKRPSLSGKQRDYTLTPQLLSIIKTTPGISTFKIRDQINDSYSNMQIKNRLADLNRNKQIENRGGGRGTVGRWYIKEDDGN